jgi:RND family efflux transporter MFP subunit
MNATRRLLSWLAVLGVTAVVLGCSNEPPLVQPPPVEVVVSQPLLEKIADWDVYTGQVESKEPVDVRARVQGEIKDVPFKKKKVRRLGKEINLEGKEVEAGELLFVIDDEPFKAAKQKAEGELKSSTADEEAADKIIKIYDPLAKQGTVSTEELVKAIGAKGKASGGIITAKGNILAAETNIKYCQITAPIAGKVGQALLTKGNIVNAGGQDNLLTTVVRVDQLYVYFYVNERALLNYQKLVRKTLEKEKKEAEVYFPVEMALTTDTGFPHKGVVDFIDNKVDPKTGAIKVGARFENPKGADGLRLLTPGLFARVRVAIADPYPAMLIADRAILSDQSLSYVLVVNKAKNNVVERVDVTVANRVQENGLRAVEAGLKGDEWVIVEGVNRARPGVTVNPKEAPMPQRPAGGK